MRAFSLAFVRLLVCAPGALAALARFALRSRPVHRAAFKEALSTFAGAAQEGQTLPPLTQIHPQVLEVERAYLEVHGPAEVKPDAPIVIHLNGTGEPLLTILPGLQQLFEHQPMLAGHRHLLVDMPHAVSAYDGADAFRDALRTTLDPVLQDHAGGLVLIGLSRGGAAALDLGASWAGTLDRPVGVIAMSPPIIGDYERPQTVRDIACLEPAMVQVGELAKVLPAWWLRIQDWCLLRSYLALTCFTLAEFEIASSPMLAWAARDVRQRPPLPSILRANREFAMLLRVDDEMLHSSLHTVARAVALHPGLSVRVLFGAEDRWVPAERCATRARESFALAEAPGDRAHVEVLDSWGHALSRQLGQDFGSLADHVALICKRTAERQR